MYGTLRELKKASRAAGKNSDDILVSLEYDGGKDNLHNLETAANRMTIPNMEQHFIDNIDPGEHTPGGHIDQADVSLRVGHGHVLEQQERK